MRGTGWTLIALAGLAWAVALLSDAGIGSGADRVINLSLLGLRLGFAVIGGALLTSGCVLLGADAVRSALAPQAAAVAPTERRAAPDMTAQLRAAREYARRP